MSCHKNGPLKKAYMNKKDFNKWIYHLRTWPTRIRRISTISRKMILEFRIQRQRC
jgi:hypothetical protein